MNDISSNEPHVKYKISNIKLYLRDISRFSRISHEEEKSLGKKIERGDKKAIEDLVTANLGLVVHVASKYQNKGISYEDLISDGNVGLMKAATKWRYKRKIRFSTYAYFWIKRQIIYALNSNSTLIRTPANLSGVANSFKNKLKSIENEKGRLTEQDIHKMFGKKYKGHPLESILLKTNTMYCDITIANVDGSGESFPRYDHGLCTESPLREIENSDGEKKLKTKVRKILEKSHYGTVLASLFGLKDGVAYSGRALAKKYGVSVQTVHNWKLEAYDKIRAYHKEEEFHDYLKVDNF
jgi:RNA polymerase primary sigma factor